MKRLPLFLLALALLATVGCKPKAKDIPPLQRKEAASLASEAQFAAMMRDHARAEPLLVKATKLCPDNGEYWVNLGISRKHLGNTSGAKSAYESARKAYGDAYEIDPTRPEPLLQEFYVMALLGKADEARKLQEKALKRNPTDARLRAFVESKQLDRMLADPNFKEMAL